jgi:hypothetical protein
VAVSAAIIDAIESVDPSFPTVDPNLKNEFKVAKATLEAEGQSDE